MNKYGIPPHLYERPMEIELIRSMRHKPLTEKQNHTLNKLLRSAEDTKDAFIVKSATEWLDEGNKQQQLTKLFGDFWTEGELCFLFADTNVGKSILAVQIGNAISRGEPITGFDMRTKPATVLYFDFELSTKQFESRYRCPQRGNYKFAPDFFRVVFNPDATGMEKFASYTDYLNNAIENLLVVSKARVIIIDNITCLRGGTEAAASALSLMRQHYSCSKANMACRCWYWRTRLNAGRQNRSAAQRHLQGSKMLINFADSAFAIGQSHTRPGLRYLKQIKQRSGEEVYSAQNVCLARIQKVAAFLQFDFTGTGAEAHHLLHYTEDIRKQTEDRILDLHRQGHPLRYIANLVGVSLNRVFITVKAMEGKEKSVNDGDENGA